MAAGSPMRRSCSATGSCRCQQVSGAGRTEPGGCAALTALANTCSHLQGATGLSGASPPAALVSLGHPLPLPPSPLLFDRTCGRREQARRRQASWPCRRRRRRAYIRAGGAPGRRLCGRLHSCGAGACTAHAPAAPCANGRQPVCASVPQFQLCRGGGRPPMHTRVPTGTGRAGGGGPPEPSHPCRRRRAAVPGRLVASR